MLRQFFFNSFKHKIMFFKIDDYVHLRFDKISDDRYTSSFDKCMLKVIDETLD